MDLSLLKVILFGRQPPVRVREGWDDFPTDGLTMGTLIIGRPGTGKTSALARHIVAYFLEHPDRAIYILDWSGAIKNTTLTLISQLEEKVYEKAVKRLVLDVLGHPDIVVPMPEFSDKYGSAEEQVQRVSQNLAKLAPHLVANAPLLGGLSIKEIGPQVFRVLNAIINEHGENWQITEAKKLLLDEGLLRRALKQYGAHLHEAKYFLERIFLELKQQERELRSYSLLALLGVIEPREIRARLGYFRPGWTPKEAIEKGLMVIVDGSRLINQRNAQHYLFTQIYSLIMQEINRRIPSNPNDQPVALVMDEVYSLLGIPGMAEEVGMLSPLYRSRKMELYVVLQSLSQLAKPLDEQIWSLGNKVIFAIENKTEAEKIAHQLFKYDPRYVKQPARTPNQSPITEPEAGQDRIVADWIQNLRFRECLMRRHFSERQIDPDIQHVSQTRALPINPPHSPIWELEEHLLNERGVAVRDALEVINQRKIEIERRQPPQV